jgi:hypothetical protein
MCDEVQNARERTREMFQFFGYSILSCLALFCHVLFCPGVQPYSILIDSIVSYAVIRILKSQSSTMTYCQMLCIVYAVVTGIVDVISSTDAYFNPQRYILCVRPFHLSSLSPLPPTINLFPPLLPPSPSLY